eukprot:TRINITY_DN1604_c0_g1_i1.p1 TRINITY_DN1604_c0_g1~~TRINITY_DN1604_c0_g1_i1.p1  ORF type:complete len:232 (-),score=71.35 TRINITY_DN1604_c0_g1_i1:13-708(-)
MTNRGAFIVLEGLDRAGKSTQTKLLFERLSKEYDTRQYRFPDRTTSIGQNINAFLQEKLDLSDEVIHLLYSANRWEKNNEIKTLLNQGYTVICDRYAYSGVVFSIAKGMDIDWCKGTDKGLVEPDHVFFLTISDNEAINRPGFGEERYETTEFQKKVRKAYTDLISYDDNQDNDNNENDDKWIYINANRSIEEISDELYEKSLNIIEKVKNNPLKKLWINDDNDQDNNNDN